MKKIIVIIIILLVFGIYILFKDDKIYYTSIIDYNFFNNYSYENYIVDYLSEKDLLEKNVSIKIGSERIIDLIRNIQDNVDYNGNSMQNILIKTDILTISVGYNDLINNLIYYSKDEIYTKIISYLKDLNEYLAILRKYDKETIILIGYYNFIGEEYGDFFNKLNTSIEKMCEEYKIKYIDLDELYRKNEYKHDTLEGEYFIFNEVRDYIDSFKKLN